jgi:hypothetical protein
LAEISGWVATPWHKFRKIPSATQNICFSTHTHTLSTECPTACKSALPHTLCGMSKARGKLGGVQITHSSHTLRRMFKAKGKLWGPNYPHPTAARTQRSSAGRTPRGLPERTRSANMSLVVISSKQYILPCEGEVLMPCTESGGNTTTSPGPTDIHSPSQYASPSPAPHNPMPCEHEALCAMGFKMHLEGTFSASFSAW